MHDLTQSIYDGMEVYPGDPDVCIKQVKSHDKDGFQLSLLSLSNHTGTHIDYPSHIIEDSICSDSYSLEYCCGKGIIIDLPHEEDKQIASMEKLDIRKNDIVFFKSKNKQKRVFLSKKTAHILCEMKIKIIGTENSSIDREIYNDYPLHNMFLINNILIVENLYMKKIKCGRCSIFIFPLKITGIDGSPCRVGVSYE